MITERQIQRLKDSIASDTKKVEMQKKMLAESVKRVITFGNHYILDQENHKITIQEIGIKRRLSKIANDIETLEKLQERQSCH